MAWPTPQDYNEAVQNPLYNFEDPELQRGEIAVTPMGLPRVASGAFASVYRMRCGDKEYAIRCFLQPVVDQRERYEAISQFVLSDDLDCTVKFEYLDRGIRIGSAWYPLIKMEWVAGQAIDGYVKTHLNDSAALLSLINNFQMMLNDMNAYGIAHGDLQHGNIIVTDAGKIRLVDYDGMYVPSLAGLDCPELGHRNYQHPKRTGKHFGPYLDNFAAWSIYVSLACLSRDPSLLDQLNGGDECLLFRLFDYKNPTRSRALSALEKHSDREIVQLSRLLRTLLLMPIEAIPRLGTEVTCADGLPDLSPNLPDWMISNENDTDDIDFRENHIYSQLEVVPATAADSWPTISQYASAIATPAASFTDPGLQKCRPLRIGSTGPVAETGGIFRLFKPKEFDSLAVRVFLNYDQGLIERYIEFSKYLYPHRTRTHDIYKFIAQFEFQRDGIRIGNRSYPILLRYWEEGSTLEDFLYSLPDQAKLVTTKKQFRALCDAMNNLGIVHGALQTSNIFLNLNTGLRVTNFDCIYVDKVTRGPRALSAGALRHPAEPAFTDAYSDRFPAWLIDTALTVLEFEPSVSQYIFQLLFDPWRVDPKLNTPMLLNSPFFRALEESPNRILRQRAQLLSCFMQIPRESIPALNLGAAIGYDFTCQHDLDFGPVPGELDLVSPDVLPPSYRLTPRSTAEIQVTGSAGLPQPVQPPPFKLTVDADTVGYALTASLVGSILLQMGWLTFGLVCVLFVFFSVRFLFNLPKN